MGGSVKRRIAGVAITGLVVAGIVGVTSMSASGQNSFTPAEGPVFQPYGTLSIQLDSGSKTYLAVLARPGLASETQVINATQPCATVDPAIGTLVSLSPTPGSTTLDTVQIRNNAFGVNTGNTSCGSSAAAVISGSERLKIELGSSLTSAKVVATSASLNLTRVKSGNLTVGFDGGAQVEAGLTSSWSSQTVVVDDALDGVFTSITIGSTSRKDNEGISVATGTSFELVVPDSDFDVAVNCGEFVNAPTVSGGIATSARYERLDNKIPENDCEEVGVRVQIQEEGENAPFDRVFWNNDFEGVNGGTTQSVQAYFTIVWAPAVLADLDREISYLGTDEDPGTPMLWCDGYDSSGIPILPSSLAPGAIDVSENETPDLRAPWCLVEDQRELAPDDTGLIIQTQKLFGSGDPWGK
jgi:hypothetical protein